MKNWAIISTWYMSLDGLIEGADILKNRGSAEDAVERAIIKVEDSPKYISVGYGGLPNERGVVELDAAFMDGDTFQIGAVGSIRDFKNPISIARRLSKEKYNNFLVGQGAEEYGHLHGFQRMNMLTEETKLKWEEKIKNKGEDLKAYDGHDTVCVLAMDISGKIVAGTSTSGLFMKKPGRIGDTPICGGGFYVDSLIGGACATGLGEDITKGCLSYEAVRRMAMGMSAEEAASSCIFEFSKKLKKRSGRDAAISLICLNKNGEFGVGTTVEFPFIVSKDDLDATVFLSKVASYGAVFEKASKDWLINPTTD